MIRKADVVRFAWVTPEVFLSDENRRPVILVRSSKSTKFAGFPKVESAQSLSVPTHRALDCSGYRGSAREDMREKS